MPSISRVTAISKPAICLPSLSKKNTLVWPTVLPMMKARRDERTTALAIFGSATSTSLMSRGRSMTTDLLTPRLTGCDWESLAATWISCIGGAVNTTLPARARGITQQPAASTASAIATRTVLAPVIAAPFPLTGLFLLC